MRDIKVIEADIAKLKAELADAKNYEAIRTSAVNILKNLGWTHTPGAGWKRPAIKTKVIDLESKTHIKAGDWVHVKTSLATGPRSGYAYVRSVRGNYVTISFACGANFIGTTIEEAKHTVMVYECKVVSYKDVVESYW